MMTEMAIPPRTRPNDRLMLFSIRSANPLFSSMMPMKMKSGTASKTEFSMMPITRFGSSDSTEISRKQRA